MSRETLCSSISSPRRSFLVIGNTPAKMEGNKNETCWGKNILLRSVSVMGGRVLRYEEARRRKGQEGKIGTGGGSLWFGSRGRSYGLGCFSLFLRKVYYVGPSSSYGVFGCTSMLGRSVRRQTEYHENGGRAGAAMAMPLQKVSLVSGATSKIRLARAPPNPRRYRASGGRHRAPQFRRATYSSGTFIARCADPLSGGSRIREGDIPPRLRLCRSSSHTSLGPRYRYSLLGGFSG